MGYRYNINEVKMRVEAAKVPQMIQALGVEAKERIKSEAQWHIRTKKETLSNGQQKSESYISSLKEKIKESEEIIKDLSDRELSHDEILENLRWTYYFDPDGSLSSMSHSDDTRDLNEEELEAIAPFVSDGSYVEASGEEFGDIFRYVFRNGRVRRVRAVISFPEDEN